MTETILSLYRGEVPKPRPTMRQVVANMAEAYELTTYELVGGRHSHKLAPARQHAMHEMHRHGYSNMQIAHVLSLEDHTSVVKGRQAHERRLAAQKAAA